MDDADIVWTPPFLNGGGWRLEKTASMGGSKFFSINGWVGKNGGGGFCVF